MLVRSYSRCSGSTSYDADVGMPRLRAASATSRSCSGLRNEKRKQTASDSTPAASTRSSSFSISAGSSGWRTVAAVVEALVRLEAKLVGHERWLAVRREVVQPRPRLPPDREHVAEAARRDQRRSGALALDDGVGGDGGAVDEVEGGGLRRRRRSDQSSSARPSRMARAGSSGVEGRL